MRHCKCRWLVHQEVIDGAPLGATTYRVLYRSLHLATRPLLPQHDGAARIVAYDVERVFADINADHGDRGIGCLRHGVLLVFGAPRQLRLLAGQEHGRTIPLTDIGRHLVSSRKAQLGAGLF
jgi:hypothetical protein